ncbi:sensor domain-containing protein, partial [Mycobacteroides abscessus]|nr:sensor domain-containing protein [Mycobacteroides abscessus]
MRSVMGALSVALGVMTPATATADPSSNVQPAAIDRL